MDCPKCGTRMIQAGIAQLSSEKIFVEMECPSCHCRIQTEKARHCP